MTYQQAYCRRFKAKHGISPMTAWRRKHPRRQAEHRRIERQRWRDNPQAHRRHYRRAAIHRRKLKVAAYEAYGGFVCRCCGVKEEAFLSLDHIKRNGRQHRAEMAGQSLYLWLRNHGYPKGFRVYCMNCNFATRHGKRCPHKKRRMEEWA